MLYTAYKDGMLYNSQAAINFPKSGGADAQIGYGAMTFLMCPNRRKSIEFVDDNTVQLIPSMTKRYMTDGVYRTKIGTKFINLIEKVNIDREFSKMLDFPLFYINSAYRPMVMEKGYNTLNDLSRWMEIFFLNSSNLAPKKKCEEFVTLLTKLYASSEYSKYSTKLLVFDIDSWVASLKSCVIMNPKLLTNPLSILLYTCRQYPELLENAPNIRIMILGRGSNQVIFYELKDVTKKNYPSIKAKLSKFKSIVFSAEDILDPGSTNKTDEVNATLIQEMKNQIFGKVKYSLTGDSKFNIVVTNDISKDIADDLDDEVDDTTEKDELDDEINTMINDELENIDDITKTDIDEIATNLAENIKTTKFNATFMPVRSEKEIEKIRRLTQDQEVVLHRNTIDDVKRKTISTSDLGNILGITNPTIQSTKFVNFDKDYTEKCLVKNIDDAVAILSKADNKIFITDKVVEDVSTPMDLKYKYTYRLIDEKDNKMSLTFEIPRIINDNYVYINGTMKNINHQLILKPIVKTSPDTVQIVTAYNKVFIRRIGKITQNINSLISFITKNSKELKTLTGTCHTLNTEYDLPVDYIMMSKQLASFTIDNNIFNLQISKNIEMYEKYTSKALKFDKNKEIPIGFDMDTKRPIMLNLSSSYSELIYSYFSDTNKRKIQNIKRKPKLVTAKAKIMGNDLPIILFLMYCEGFSAVMKKANIEYKFVTKDDLKSIDRFNYDVIALNDGYIVWKKAPFRNELLMNGLKSMDLSVFDFADMESKDTFISLVLEHYPGKRKINTALDNFKDFLLDDKSKEILQDLGYPSDLVSLFIVAAGLLCDNDYLIENNQNNMRVRSNEVISDLVYITVTNAYTAYRNTAYKKKPTKLSVKPSIIIDKLLDSDTNMIEEFSVLNPILELEKRRAVTFKGIRGIQMSRAMTLPRRSYDKSMLGTIGMTTSPDANVGVVRQLTLEPQITSTYGYIDASKAEDVESLSASNLFTVGELINPFGIMHDDPDRSAMSYKQTKYMVSIKDSDPVLVGNRVESVIPYLLSDEFVVVAKEDGKVIEKTNDFCIVEYKSGKKYAIDISTRIKKNSSNGSWVDNTLRCSLELGATFKKHEILAYNDKHFSENIDIPGISMNLGALVKIAISSQWDIYEDSAPISKRAAEKLVTEMVDEKHISISKNTYIDQMCKIGDKVKAGDTLLKFSDAIDDELQVLFDAMREENKEAILDSSKTTISSKYTGEIMDIKIYTTVPTEELHPSLRKIVEEYQKRIKRRNKVLNQHQNADDMKYYKLGQIINETEDIINVGNNGKIKGHEMGVNSDVLILIYIKYEVSASKGDKVVVSVCKGIVSHIFKEGMEPYSEYRPDEIIDTVIAPLAVSARKVPAIFLTMFTNKLLIELKKQLKDIYLEDE